MSVSVSSFDMCRKMSIRKEKSKVLYVLIVLSSLWPYLLFQSMACAEDTLGASIDCTDVSVNYSDDSTLTREERLRLMDKAFFESLNKFELCQAAKKKAAADAAGAGDGGGGGGGTKSAADGAGGEKGSGAVGGSAVQSVASSSMSGTEMPKELPPAEGLEPKDSGALHNPQDMAKTGGQNGGNSTLANGKLPEDIPSAKNDDALAAQIRYAAENEPDPVKSKQLWNEYRKYKGLPTK